MSRVFTYTHLKFYFKSKIDIQHTQTYVQRQIFDFFSLKFAQKLKTKQNVGIYFWKNYIFPTKFGPNLEK